MRVPGHDDAGGRGTVRASVDSRAARRTSRTLVIMRGGKAEHSGRDCALRDSSLPVVAC